MLLKQPMLRFLQQSSQQLKLTYQSALHSIQILNILEHYQHSAINRLIHKSMYRSKCLSLGVLSLCTKIHEINYVHIRELAKLIHPKYQDLKVNKLEQQDETVEEQEQDRQPTLSEIEQELKQWEVRVVLWMKWKLAVPLLYDEVLSLAFLWDQHTSFLVDFPLKFEAPSPINGACYSDNHNFLATNICVCLYNFNHLIGKSSLQELSVRIKRLAVAIFVALIKKLMRQKVKLNHYMLSPKLSVIRMLEEFLSKNCSITFPQIIPEVLQIEDIFRKYRKFRRQSRQKKDNKDSKELKITKKKALYRSNKVSEQKQNTLYFVNRKKSQSKKIVDFSQQNTQKYKSRSRSKKQKSGHAYITQINAYDISRYNKRSVEVRDQFKIARPKDSNLRTNKRKSNSTKSIISRNPALKKDKGPEPEPKRQKKPFANKSKISKRSQKSQLNSKIIANPSVQEVVCSHSTYWLRSGTHAKADKVSNNSEIRMKMR